MLTFIMKTFFYSVLFIFITNSCKSNQNDPGNDSIMIILSINENYSHLQMDTYKNIVSKRLQDFYNIKPTFLIHDSIIKINVPELIDSSGILNTLLTNNGKFEIWPTYENMEIHQIMNSINNAIIDLRLEDRFVCDTSPISSEFPFFNKLIPMVDHEGYLVKGPFAGMAYEQDEKLIDSVISLKFIRDSLPISLIFRWYIKSKKDFFPLIAMNNLNNTKAPITTNMIQEVFIKKESLGNHILIQLKKEYYDLFKNLSSDNIGRALAIAIGDKVISISYQNEEVNNGNIRLWGDFTTEEQDMILILLKNGEFLLTPPALIRVCKPNRNKRYSFEGKQHKRTASLEKGSEKISEE